MTEKEIRTNQEHARAEARVTTPAGKPDAAPGEPQRSPGGETGKAAGVSEERAERPGPKLVCANPLDPFGQSFHEPVPLSEEEAMLAAARLGFTHFIDIPEGETMVNVLWKKKTAWKLCGIYLIIHRSG
ncbi:hypothetical protein, partial [Sutterella sp.]|uniref:hypothetical protein n=1 Tax=Sutterella sp. TaxID=1981025 RepID=UPI0026E05D1F